MTASPSAPDLRAMAIGFGHWRRRPYASRAAPGERSVLFAKRCASISPHLFGDGHATFAHDLLAKIQHDDADFASIIMLLIVLVVGSSVNGRRAGLRWGRCVFSLRSLPAVAVLLPSGRTICVRLRRCEITCAALKPMGVTGAGGVTAGAA